MEEVAIGNQEQKPLVEALETAVKRRIAGDTNWNVNNLLTHLETQLHMSPEQMAQELQHALVAAGGIDLSAKEEMYITQVIELLESQSSE